ncbi:3-deoxy-D-manno-octulosonic acid kinase [Psychromonas hadalis]|uniref:3-deoxy-D-manno-octulosonic acid kinase n=1 Tax=Psychromonas hadalis TaxID=211669 RepID=UPI0003B71EB4|nr:3-deoxy-D-manno-octulosonic acid kinase [Psychromonas hadalis]
MHVLKTEKYQIYYDPTLIRQINVAHFSQQFWQENNAIIGSAQGRGTTWFVQLDKLQGALRHYHRGGLFAKLVHDHYLFLNWQNTRSLQEFTLLTHLINQGVHVPRPIAAIATKRIFCYQADLITEKIKDAQDLVTILKKETINKNIYRAIGVEIKKMHNAQVNHSDLNIHNILIDKHLKIWIIDFDKCAIQSSRHYQQKNLQRLKRSFLKESAKVGILWNEIDWQHLLNGYQQAEQ